jgi:hypothetical protein
MRGKALMDGRIFLGPLVATVLLGGASQQAWAVAYTVIDLTPSGFTNSAAYGTNGLQQVGGGSGSATGNRNHALLWSGTAASAIDLNPSGFDDTSAPEINGSQQVGHDTGPATGGQRHAVLWSGTAASAVDLNPTGFSSSRANAVSGLQQVGYGSGVATVGQIHALLWSSTAASAVDLNPKRLYSVYCLRHDRFPTSWLWQRHGYGR